TEPDHQLHHLHHLDLTICRLRDEGASQLILSPLGLQLTYLDLSDNHLTADTVHALTRPLSEEPSQLTHLLLDNNPIGTEGILLLSQSARLSNLTHLHLRNVLTGHSPDTERGSNHPTDALHTLLTSPHLSHLTHLDLSLNPIGDRGAHQIAEAAHHLTHLKSLDLSRTGLTSDGIQALAQAQGLSGLTELRLDINRQIGRWGHRALITSPHLSESLKVAHLTRLHVQPLAQLAEDLQLNHRGANDKGRLLSLLLSWLGDR
ncbi:MAG: hypothetical protein AAFS10_07110, partial [Myxococcota bacterium]